jgi:DNA-binding beta-propeller fold protein YncE
MTFAGSAPGLADGKGEKVKFNTPRGICFNPHDECLYVCDKRNNSIRKITLQGTFLLLFSIYLFYKILGDVSTFVRGSEGQLSWPQEIVMHYKTKTFYVTNEYAHNIVMITSEGTKKGENETKR